MSLPNEKKLKNLLEQWVSGTVATSRWLESLGISKQLRLSYQKGEWLKLISTGAFKRPGEEINWLGAVYTLQKQLNLPIHPGALTALALQGQAHYLRANEVAHLFAPTKTPIPQWFKSLDWNSPLATHYSNFLPPSVGLLAYTTRTFSIAISTPERALLECLYLAPSKFDLVECFHIIEGLVNLRPKLLKELLQKCSSIKVNRLFFYMAEKANHSWLKHVDKTTIAFGRGPRTIVKQGVFIKDYDMTIPRELAEL